MPEFKKILIANRGEIAIRIMRAANEMGKKTVASMPKKTSSACTASKPMRPIESARAWDRWPPISAFDEIIRVARASGADAIHPGYGLLSENPDFVDACDAAGITFIGPKSRDHARSGR